MPNENNFVTQEELTEYLNEFTDVMTTTLTGVLKHFEQLNQARDEALERFERQLALLTQAYSEIVANVESLISVVINRTPEQRDEFFQTLTQSRKNMMEVLRAAQQEVHESAETFNAEAADVSKDD